MKKKKTPKGLKFDRIFVPQGQNPYAHVKWVKREARIQDSQGQIIFAKKNITVPATWSQLALDIAASKYFRGREKSVRQLIDRVVDTIAKAGVKGRYFTAKEARIFAVEIKYMCVEQIAAFNSPVWFNCGVHSEPQCSACFILSVQDSLMSIFELAKTEAKIFKYGSGVGANFSHVRGRGEPLRGGGKSSGLLAFLEMLDRGAAATKSGGTTRRAAKMVTLDADHPEIFEFVQWKPHEENKARVLLKAGYSGGLDGEAYRSVSGQNSNNSVRVTDAFLKAVLKNKTWWTKARVNGKKLKSFKAQDLWNEITQAAWQCADPGLQFHDTINSWHTCPKNGPIQASNPCSEYMFVNDSACNLASLNLSKFLKPEGSFSLQQFTHAVRLLIVAQEILVGLSSYPTESITKNSTNLRPLGLGYANLGGLLMRLALPYDSEEGRAWAAAITALMTGVAYTTSSELSRLKGPFADERPNRPFMLRIIQKHKKSLRKISNKAPSEIKKSAEEYWQKALENGKKFGFRHAQVTCLAPTGTIGLLMDCETTGIEPDFALVKTKYLAGGGQVQIVNQAVKEALKRLGYKASECDEMMKYLIREGSLTHHPTLRSEHLAIFDCAQPSEPKGRALSAEAHLLMMAAVQPFLSGAISKTVNLPADATEADVSQIYLKAWKLGLKSIAIYRDQSKGVQPLVLAPVCSQCG